MCVGHGFERMALWVDHELTGGVLPDVPHRTTEEVCQMPDCASVCRNDNYIHVEPPGWARARCKSCCRQLPSTSPTGSTLWGEPVHVSGEYRRDMCRHRAWKGDRVSCQPEMPEAVTLQKPLPNGVLRIVARGEKEDGRHSDRLMREQRQVRAVNCKATRTPA